MQHPSVPRMQATAMVSVLAGSFADWFQARRGLSPLTMRRLMQNIATLGGALSLLPLALLPAAAVPTPLAVASLTLAVAAQGFNYGERWGCFFGLPRPLELAGCSGSLNYTLVMLMRANSSTSAWRAMSSPQLEYFASHLLLLGS